MVTHICNPSYSGSGEGKIKDPCLSGQKCETLSAKYSKKGLGAMEQTVECVSSKHKALSSNSSTAKIKLVMDHNLWIDRQPGIQTECIERLMRKVCFFSGPSSRHLNDRGKRPTSQGRSPASVSLSRAQNPTPQLAPQCHFCWAPAMLTTRKPRHGNLGAPSKRSSHHPKWQSHKGQRRTKDEGVMCDNELGPFTVKDIIRTRGQT
jgi:hypothetical protein